MRGTKFRKFNHIAAAHFRKFYAEKGITTPGGCVILIGRDNIKAPRKNGGINYRVSWGRIHPKKAWSAKVRTYQAAYMTFNECDLPAGKHVHHTCGNWNCCNPAHLQLCTPEEHALLDRDLRLTEGRMK